MELKKSQIKMWSRLGTRAAYGLGILELSKKIDNLMVLTGDTSTSAGLDRFKKKFPDRYLEVGIAEQNMMGIAAGLSSEGFKVITSTFSPFQTLRCCERIKVNVGYMNHKVCMVGLASGIALSALGYTHCSIEDISIMRSIPGITILSPADCGETVKATAAALGHNGSVYIRITGETRDCQVYDENYDFKIGKAVTLKEGSDVTIFATGTMVKESLLASERLSEMGISASVVNMHTIKPIDKEAIQKACETTKLIVSAEEHNMLGGLGSAISEYKSTITGAPPQLFIGLPDAYGKAGNYDSLLKGFGLTAEGIFEKIASKIKN